MADELRPGLVGKARTVVDQLKLASYFGSGGVDVYATPAMIGLMENAAVNAVDRLLPSGSASVGSVIEVRHLAATPAGVEVNANAELVEVNGRQLKFRVEAFDTAEKIGEGTHERVVVDLDRLIQKADAKRPRAGQS
jgi:fluoroacetyl-CoA thioesterase